MAREIAKTYEPQQIEPRWADFWVREQLFRADPNAPGPVFSIVIPPPNVTGSLHIGHMLDHTEIDILTRWHRMRGYNTLYLPGMDHAGISTQRVVVRELAEQGIDYRTLGREEFIRRVWKWKEESGGKITQQMKQIGESCDWSREKFTLSPELSRVVRMVFMQLYEQGLIYRAHYMTNWCPVCLTVLSDLEVLHEERAGHLWHIRYPVVGTNEHIVVATTRPETMLGDTAVAVHPEDERYKHLVGKRVLLPLMEREIPIIADEMVDREFGTGAVKITPAHDPNDFELGRRHHLPEIDVMTDDGHMSAAAGAYAGLDRFEARKKIVEDLKARGLLEKITEHTHAVGICERSRTIVEPRASTQWFCKMKPLAEPAIAAVERGDIQIVPENRRQEYFNWMRNIRDWTLSRQLWWGHRIPAWYCEDCKQVNVAVDDPAKCMKCGSPKLRQDPDVLDTWFSSGLWPFSTLGWPDDTPDYRRYYPTTLLITGYDILFFWVARMAMLGLHLLGEVPFRTVFLHAMVRDEKGEKMSKTRGIVIDPTDATEKYGADALRMTLASMAGQGRDIKLDEKRIEGYRAFANKIWNAARFVLRSADGYDPDHPAPPASVYDRWILSRFQRCADETRQALEEFRLNDAANGIYRFVWGELCDWAIELSKPALYGDRTPAERAGAQSALLQSLEGALRLLHPFMPFVTEEVWQRLPKRRGHAPSIMIERYPAPDSLIDPRAEAEMDTLVRAIDGARSLRGEVNLPPNQAVPLVLVPRDAPAQRLFETHRQAFSRLANATEVQVLAPGAPRPRKAAVHVE